MMLSDGAHWHPPAYDRMAAELAARADDNDVACPLPTPHCECDLCASFVPWSWRLNRFGSSCTHRERPAAWSAVPGPAGMAGMGGLRTGAQRTAAVGMADDDGEGYADSEVAAAPLTGMADVRDRAGAHLSVVHSAAGDENRLDLTKATTNAAKRAAGAALALPMCERGPLPQAGAAVALFSLALYPQTLLKSLPPWLAMSVVLCMEQQPGPRPVHSRLMPLGRARLVHSTPELRGPLD